MVKKNTLAVTQDELTKLRRFYLYIDLAVNFNHQNGNPLDLLCC